MNKTITVLALTAILSSGSSMAAECMAPSFVQSHPGLSVVAPEMQPVNAMDPACTPASEAIAALRAQSAAALAQAPAAYVPLTKDDNTPWRFDMSQNGKQMTSVEFDAWMKKKGIRVATGKSTTVPAADAEAQALSGSGHSPDQ